jgi:hypothetical protein
MHLALDFPWMDWWRPTSWVNRGCPNVGLFEDPARIAGAVVAESELGQKTRSFRSGEIAASLRSSQ